MIQVITSFDQRYYDLIGKDCVDTFLKYWPIKFKLTCYVENFELPATNRLNQIPFSKLDPDFNKLQQEHFHPSVKKFAKKAYPVIHAMYNSTADWIVWLDADVVTQEKIPRQFWEDLLDPGALSMYMGVTYTTDKSGNPGDWLVPETGVFAVNTQHPDFNAFRNEYRRRYVDRDQNGLRRFYDNDVFGVAIRLLPNAKYIDLCAEFLKPYKTPIRHTVLGPYLIHYKAKHSKAEYGQTAEDQ